MNSPAAGAVSSSFLKSDDFRPLLTLTLLLLALHGAVGLLIPWDTQVVCNDDWAYAWACRNWYEQGSLLLHPAAMAWGLPQILFANLCCLICRTDSGQFLRGVGLLIGLASVYVLYASFRVFEDSPRFALRKSALLAASPLLLPLSWSFMTDMTFLLLIVLSITLLARAEQTGRPSAILWAGVAIGLAALQRQYGLALVLIPLVRPAFWRPGRRWASALAILLPWLLLGLVWKWLDAGGGNATGLGPRLKLIGDALMQAPGRSLANFGSASLQSLAFISLFWLPFELLSPRRLQPYVLIGCAAACILSDLKIYCAPPAEFGFAELDRVTWSHFYNLGLIGAGLYDTAVIHLPRTGAPDLGWLVALVHFVSLISGALLLSRIIEALGAAAQAGPRHLLSAMPLPLLSFLLMLGAVVSISVLSNFYLFDRYLLISVVLAGFLYQETKPRSRGVLALQWMFIAALGAYSIAGTVDYWNWTGACFRLIDKLLVRGADPAEIDGGYCYHGLKTPVKIAADGKVDPNWETYWTIRRRTYVVEFFPGGRFDREVDRRPFFTPLYRREDSVLYLHQLDFGP